MKKDQKGQSLLEITVLLGVLLVIVTAIVTLTINGLRNSQFAKNQSQATKLAQEGLEIVRVMKTRDCPVIASSSLSWTSDSNSVWSANINSEVFRIRFDDTLCQLEPTTNGEIIGTNPQSQFRRRVRILSDTGSTAPSKRVEVEVEWNDASGKHTSNLVTILAK